MHKLKALGLALVAVFAMSAVVTSVAHGQGKFTTTSGAVITGTQLNEHKFTTEHGVVTCTGATLEGVAKEAEPTEQELTATYGGCKFAGLNASVNMTGCVYIFKAGNTIEGSPNTITSSVYVKCPESTKIHVKIIGSTCEITVGTQTIANGITLHNSGTELHMDLIAEIKVPTGITYTVHNPDKCPNPKPKETGTTFTHEGKYEGKATVTAETVGKVGLNLTVH